MAYKPKDQSGFDYASMSGMTAAHQKALTEAGQAWQRANAAGNQAAMDAAHAMAESIRAQYGYSGGEDGSEYIVVQKEPAQTRVSRSSSGYDLSGYLRQQKAAETEAALASLRGAYQKSIAGYDRVKDSLSDQYEAAKNRAAAQAALARKAFAEQAGASGLNSGTAGQAALARSSTLRRDLAGLDSDRAGKLADLDVERSKLQADYEAAIAKAKAEGDASLASALYQELVRVQEMQREDEQRQIALDQAAEELAYSREQNDKKWVYQLGRDKLEDERYAEETAYSRALAAQKLAQKGVGTEADQQEEEPFYAVKTDAETGGRMKINTGSKLALGYGNLTDDEVYQLVRSGDVEAYEVDGQWYLRRTGKDSAISKMIGSTGLFRESPFGPSGVGGMLYGK